MRRTKKKQRASDAAKLDCIKAIMAGESVVYGPITISGAVLVSATPIHVGGGVQVLKCFLTHRGIVDGEEE